MSEAEITAYIRDNYGSCALGSGACVCLKPGHPWLGADCRNWKPWNARTWTELRQIQETQS